MLTGVSNYFKRYCITTLNVFYNKQNFTSIKNISYNDYFRPNLNILILSIKLFKIQCISIHYINTITFSTLWVGSLL